MGYIKENVKKFMALLVCVMLIGLFPIGANAVDYPEVLVNGSFEYPVISKPLNSQWFVYRTLNSGEQAQFGWKKTVLNSNTIEFGGDWNVSGWGIQFIPEGRQFIELNADEQSAFYQDLSTNPGDVFYWSLYQGGVWYSSDPDIDNTMAVRIGTPNELKTRDTMISTTMTAYDQSWTSRTIYEINAKTEASSIPSAYNGKDLDKKRLYTEPKRWTKYEGVYIVPEGQTVTRFVFASLSTRPLQGNLLDDVVFRIGTTEEVNNQFVAVAKEAKEAAENASYSDMRPDAAHDEAAIKDALKLAAEEAINDSRVTTTINEVNYLQPITGTPENANGTNGSYEFTISVSIGEVTQTTPQKTITIIATTYSEALAAAKAEAKADLATKLATYSAGNYSAANWIALNNAKTAGDTAIDEAADIARVTTAKNATLAAMAAIKTKLQEAEVTLPLNDIDNSGHDYMPGLYVGKDNNLNFNGTGTYTFKGGLQAAGIGGKGVPSGSGTVDADSFCGTMTFGAPGEIGNFKIIAHGGEWGAGIGDGDSANSNTWGSGVTVYDRQITVNSGIIIGYAGAAAGIGTQDQISADQKMILDFKNSVEGSFVVGASSGACGVGAGKSTTMKSGNLKVAGYVMGLSTGSYVPISEKNTVQEAAIDPNWTILSYTLNGGIGAGSRIYITKEGSDIPVYDYVIPVGYTKLAMSFKVGATYGGSYTIMFGNSGYKTINTTGMTGGGFVSEIISPNGYATSVTLGNNMSLDQGSGSLTQGGNAVTAITPIKIKADNGYILPESWNVGNGLSYTRNTPVTATITGNLQMNNVVVTVPNATEETAEALAAAKVTAKGDLTAALAGYTEGDYTVANWTILTTAKTDGDVAIDAAANLAAVGTAKTNALDAMDAVKTIAETTAGAEAAAVKAINDATAEEMAAAISSNAAILGLVLDDYTALTNKVPVHEALAALDGSEKATIISTFNTAVATQKVAEALAVAKATDKADLATTLATYTAGNYSAANWTALNNAKTAGDTAIEAAADLAGVTAAKEAALAAMAAVKTLAEEAAEALVAAKATDKADLATKLAAYTEGNYSADNWTALNNAKTAGDAAIEAATDLAGVTAAKEAAIAAMDAVKTLAEEAAEALATAKTTAKTDLATKLATYTEANYSAANWTALNNAKTAGDTAIDAAADTAGVTAAKEAAIAAMDAVKTLAEEAAEALAAAKTTAKADLATKLGTYTESNYSADNWAALNNAKTDGDAAIEVATDMAGVTAAKEAALAAMDAIKTLAEEAAEALVAAKATDKADLATKLATYTEGNYSAANWTALNDAKTAGDTAIDGATDTAGVTAAKEAALAAMAAVKTLAEEAAEALAAAKTTAKADLATKLGTYTESNYSAANWTALNNAKTAGDAAIEAATDIVGITAVKESALAAMDAVKTIDITPPTLTAGEVSRTSDTSATVKFTSSEGGSYYYKIGSAPDTSSSGTAFSAGEITINLTDLTEGAREIYILAKDMAGNVSLTTLRIAIPAYETSTYQVGGTVKDYSSNVLSGATVKLMAGQAQIGITATTDANGAFIIAGVPNGTYNLVISKDGIVVTTIITVTNGDYAAGTITLPVGKTNSVVVVNGSETPNIVVAKLDNSSKTQ